MQTHVMNNNIDNSILQHLQRLQSFIINNNIYDNNILNQVYEIHNYLINTNNVQTYIIINMINVIYNNYGQGAIE